MSQPCSPRKRFAPIPALLLPLLCFSSGCFVIPVGDLLRGPELREQILVDARGFFGGEKIAILDVDGVISGDESPGLVLSSKNLVAETKAKLQWVRSDPEVKAVVLRISSPGGEVTACDVLYHELQRFREETRLPLIASIGDVGASGGYYIAMAAEKVFSNPTAIVGSIGVIFHHLELHELLQKVGVSASPIKSAAKKDLGSPMRAMAPDEREILQKLVDDMYARFLEVVRAGRPGLTQEALVSLADGRVFSGVQARRLGLVDEVGYLGDALREARDRAGISSPTIIRYTRTPSSGANIYTALGVEAPERPELRISLSPDAPRKAGAYYLWQPGL